MTVQPMPGGLYTVHAFEDLAIGRSESLMRTVMERDVALDGGHLVAYLGQLLEPPPGKADGDESESLLRAAATEA